MRRDWRKSSLGLLVILAFLLTLGTLFQDVRFDQSLARERTSLAHLEREIGALEVALADFRGAQTGYLTAGQSHDVSLRRAAELSQQIDAALGRLRESTTSPDARARYDAAQAALTTVTDFDKRARELAETDQRLLAADVLLVDSVEGHRGITGEIAAARQAENAAAEARFRRLSRLRFALNAAAMGIVLMVALYVGRPAKQPPVSEAASMAQMLRDLPPPVKPPAPAVRVAPPPPPPPPPTLAVNLGDAAELCVDLARVIDSRDVPGLLERVATVLDAKGVIIWTVESGSSTLRPSLTHGYSEKVLTRLGVLDVGADNVTSLAFRSMRPQTMTGAAPGASGAIAVPLMTATGCSGVLSAEVRENKPDPDRLALTKILAAQFATLIAPTEISAARAATN
jgi:hypothetical protein